MFDELTLDADVRVGGRGTVRIDSIFAPGLFEDHATFELLGSRFTVGPDLHLEVHEHLLVDARGADFTNEGAITFFDDVEARAQVYRFINRGQVKLRNAQVSITGDTFINEQGAQFVGTGSLDIQGRTFINHGVIAPGLSPGRLDLASDLAITSTGSMNLQLGTNSDELHVAGGVTLDGLLTLALLDGYTPQHGQMFQVIAADSVSGRFDRVQGVASLASLYLAVLYEDDAVWVRASTPGDANVDGMVDLDDFFLLRDHFGAAAAWSQGDFDGSGFIDLDDFFLLRDHFGIRDPASLATLAAFEQSAVPEPATLGLLLIGAPLLLRRRRGRSAAA